MKTKIFWKERQWVEKKGLYNIRLDNIGQKEKSVEYLLLRSNNKPLEPMVFLAFNLEQEESGIEKVNANSSLSLSLL
jgi:hypothetical protein